eukprot:9594405-Alexandrium_andersonii.AAC.1
MSVGRFSRNLGVLTTEGEEAGVPGGGTPTGSSYPRVRSDWLRLAMSCSGILMGGGGLPLPSCLGLPPAPSPPNPPDPPPSPPPPPGAGAPAPG